MIPYRSLLIVLSKPSGAAGGEAWNVALDVALSSVSTGNSIYMTDFLVLSRRSSRKKLLCAIHGAITTFSRHAC